MCEVQVDCMHLRACQAGKSVDFIGPQCLAYGTRSRKKEMAWEYAKSCGGRRRAGKGKLEVGGSCQHRGAWQDEGG